MKRGTTILVYGNLQDVCMNGKEKFWKHCLVELWQVARICKKMPEEKNKRSGICRDVKKQRQGFAQLDPFAILR